MPARVFPPVLDLEYRTTGNQPDNRSIRLPSGNNSLSGGLSSYDIGNAWTIMLNIKPDNTNTTNPAGRQTYFHISDSSPAVDLDNRIDIAGSGTALRLDLIDESGNSNERKTYFYHNTVSGSIWFHFVTTWDGSNLNFYKDGIQRSPDSITNDDVIDQNATADKKLFLGKGDFTPERLLGGNIYSVAIWDVAISGSQISSIYNGGGQNLVNLKEDFGDYTSSANLQHWYRLGQDPNNKGKDHGNATAVDLDVEEGTVSIVTDYPGI